jgi:hypothetical protein
MVPSKSAFIRSRPVELPAAQVVADAQAEGLRITPSMVHSVRQKQRQAVDFAIGQARANYVRNHPHLSPEQLVAKAGADGVRIDVGYVRGFRVFASGDPAGRCLARLIGLSSEGRG